jgi:hypothetical protein
LGVKCLTPGLFCCAGEFPNGSINEAFVVTVEIQVYSEFQGSKETAKEIGIEPLHARQAFS